MLTKCPKCNLDTGYYIKYIVSMKQCYTFKHVPDGFFEELPHRGGTRKYCQECNKDITKHVNVV